jgi:drug/metabolite transporter (DMT)-like permease
MATARLERKPILFAIIASSLFGLSTPFSKLLTGYIHPVALAGLFYLGVFAGLSLYWLITQSILKIHGKNNEQAYSPLSGKDLIWLSGATISGGVLAPICLMLGLIQTSGFSASLLLNLEAVATALIAILIFRENAGKYAWLALLSMTIAGVFLTWDSTAGKFNTAGLVLIIIAMICWGIDNNLTRHISDKNPVQISVIKGLAAGSISIAISLIMGAKILPDRNILFALLVGALCYGISLIFFIKALRNLGAYRTAVFFSFGPFIGAIVSLFLLNEWIGWTMLPGMIFMIIGVRLIINDTHLHGHGHKELCHTHQHAHDDMHHIHEHPEGDNKCHLHEHRHNELEHAHPHWPDTSHRHDH